MLFFFPQETGLSILREIGLTAQSGLGEGEITYRLMGISSSSRITAALTVPHVIRLVNKTRLILSYSINKNFTIK